GCECDRFVEVWNLVFTQFDSDGNNHYVPLEHPNIDTGMGLERLACVMQGVDNLFLVDTVQNIMKHISKIADVQYGEDDKTDVSLRVITDHIRSTTFMIGDGVMPSNEGRGYVLRRLLRRAARHGKLIGIDHPFLSQVAETVIRENENAYPELRDKAEMIKKLINYEEESFYRTIDQGLSLLNNFIDNANTNVFSGDDAFKLNDTYGFPLDLTKEILQERGMVVDEERFKALLLQQRDRARNARKNAEAEAWTGEGNVLENIAPTEFLGYDCMRTNSKILAIVKDGQRVNSADAGDEVIVVLDQTAFYAESGGQVGDQGILEGSGFTADVVSTTKNQHGQYLLKAIVEAGTFFEGDSVDALVNVIRRRAIMRNHTAAHLLQASLRKILGAHVEQAGQLVDENKVRFDFTHFSALTAVQLAAVESFVNSEIMKASTVECREMPIGEAKKLGAMALFGEKYGDRVRVVSVGEEFSKEFCGGTHVSNTAKLGLFKIVGEASAAAGIRRIEAVTGMGVMKLLNETTAILHDTASTLKVNNISELPGKAAHLNSEMREKEKALDGLNAKLAALSLKGLFTEAETVKGVKIISALISGADTNALRAMCDRVRDMAQENAVAAVFAGVVGEKAMLVAACSKSARELGLKAGNLVKAVAEVTGGNGGGKPDFAMAGAKDISKLDDALHAIPKIIEDQI
ncbi:MAG: alanine--tRNA ligase, partial [Oscillospiraceae bacterium]